MEKLEENTETIKRERRKRRRRRESSSSSFSLDLTTEIFSRLPTKSVLRFRCVSKLWSSITKEPYFKNLFTTQSSTGPSLLLFFRKCARFSVFSIPQHNKNPNKSYSYSSARPFHDYKITYPEFCSFTTKAESVQGLICFQRSRYPIIWNPTMRQFSILSKPDKSWKRLTVFLGYDPIEAKHKVVCLPCAKTCDECRVLTLGSDLEKSWRRIKTDHIHRALTGYSSGRSGHIIRRRCINGVLYYQAFIGHGVRVIMRFDVKSEKLDMIELPSWGKKVSRMEMISYEGKLAFCDSSGNNRIEIWVLKDAEKREWSNCIFSPLNHYEVNLKKKFKLVGSTCDGDELIYVPRMFLDPFDIIYILIRRERHFDAERFVLESCICAASHSEELCIKELWILIFDKAMD